MKMKGGKKGNIQTPAMNMGMPGQTKMKKPRKMSKKR